MLSEEWKPELVAPVCKMSHNDGTGINVHDHSIHHVNNSPPTVVGSSGHLP